MNKFQSIRHWICWASIYKDLDFILRGVKVSVQEHLQKRVIVFWNVWLSSGIYCPRCKDLWKNMLEFHWCCFPVLDHIAHIPCSATVAPVQISMESKVLKFCCCCSYFCCCCFFRFCLCCCCYCLLLFQLLFVFVLVIVVVVVVVVVAVIVVVLLLFCCCCLLFLLKKV